MACSTLLTTLCLLFAPLQVLPDGPLALVGADVLPAAGAEPIEGAVVLVREGRIEALGQDIAIPADAYVVDAGGLTLAPALVDAGHHAELGFAEQHAMVGRPVDDTRDTLSAMVEGNRLGLTPERSAWRGLAPDGADLEAHRKQGFGALLLAPERGILSGSASWLLPTDLPAREALIAADVAQFGSLHYRGPGRDYSGSNYPATLMGRMAHLRQVLLDAQHRALVAARHTEGRSLTRPVQDEALMALQPVVEGQLPLVIEAREEEDIRLALGLAQEFPGLRIVLSGGHEAWELADELAEAGVSVLLDVSFPDEPDEPEEEGADDDESAQAAAMPDEGWARPAPYADDVPQRLVADRHERWLDRVSGAATLVEAGVPLAFASLSGNAKDLVKGVRTAVKKGGLDADAALTALTTGPRRALGAGAPEGVLREGAPALITGWSGDPLAKKSAVKLVLVEGRLFDLRTATERREVGQEEDDDGDEEDSDEADEDEEEDEPRRRGRRGWRGTDEPNPVEESAEEAESAADERDGDGEDEGDDDPEAYDGPLATTPYQVGLAASQRAHDDVDWPVELDADRVPATRTGGDVLLRGGHLHTVSDGVHMDTDLLVRDGRIEALGTDLALPDGVTEVDVSGRWIAPGVLDAHAHIAIRGGVNEWTRNVTPEVTIEDEVDPDDVGIYRALAGGTTSARLLHGSANAIGGRHEVVKLRWGVDAPDMVFEGAPRGVKFALGENPRQANWGDGDRFPKTRMGVASSLRRAFEDARRYQDSWSRFSESESAGLDPDPPRRDLRLEALVGILVGEIAVHSHCYRAHEIVMLMAVAEEYGFKIATFQHVLEGYKVAREIAAHGGLGASTFIDWWGFKFEAYDAIPYNPALVHEAGVMMSINSDSGDHIRRLNLEAAKAVKYGGVPEDDALAMVTLTPATQLGVDDRVGSIEEGKDADLAVYSGHPFDTRSRVVMTLVDGEVHFERSDGRYDAWEAELASRIAAGRRAMASVGDDVPGAEPPRMAEARNRDVGADALMALALPDRGTGAPSSPTRPAPGAIALVGGRVHTMVRVDGELLVHDPGTVLMKDGRLADVLEGAPPADWLERDGYTVVDVSGREIWPGMIDAGSTVGLGEISMVKQSMDTSEPGRDQADMRASTAWHPASEAIPVARVNGITSSLVVPGGNGIMGQSALMALEGWTVDEALVDDGAALHVSVPWVDRHDDDAALSAELRAEQYESCDHLTGGSHGGHDVLVPAFVREAGAGGGDDDKLHEDIAKAWDHLTTVMADAREYARRAAVARDAGTALPPHDPRLEAIAPFALGEGKVHFHCDGASQIADALDFADREGLDAVIVGGRDAWKVADRLALSGVPVIVGPVLGMPSGRHGLYDSTYANAGMLQRAGVPVAFRTAGAHNVRNLPYNAAMAVAYGLDEDAAMEGLTAGAAEILGQADELGRLSAGLRADVVVTDGSPLQIRTRIEAVYIGGRDVGLESKHTRLYDTYRERLLDPALPSGG
jgi:imidazolonepropionase-like amidohydrolase